MKICILYSMNHQLNFLQNLVNMCDVCDYCTYCRPSYLNFSNHIHGIYQISPDLPQFLEDPQSYLPHIPECDLVLAFNIHPDLLLELPDLLRKSQVKALIGPADAPKWVKPGLRRQLQEQLEELHIEYAFPKPYCSLNIEASHPFINQIIKMFRIGKPKIRIELRNNSIRTATCVRSAPCGSTYYVCERLKNASVHTIKETVSAAHHAYPCNASMDSDPETGDTLLHRAGYIIQEAVLEALEHVRIRTL
jgi:hypothetical protein